MAISTFRSILDYSLKKQEERDRASERRPVRRVWVGAEDAAHVEEMKRELKRLESKIDPAPKGDPMAPAPATKGVATRVLEEEKSRRDALREARARTLSWASKHALQYMSTAARRRGTVSESATEWRGFNQQTELEELLHNVKFRHNPLMHHVSYQSHVTGLVMEWGEALHRELVDHILDRMKVDDSDELARVNADLVASVDRERIEREAHERAELEADLAALTLREEHPELGSW